MADYTRLRETFHLIDRRTLWSTARKPFWPASHGGRVIHDSEFQNLLRAEKGKVLLALSLLKDPANGLADKVYLGEEKLAAINPNHYLANYLYITGVIHPRFFSEALHAVAANAKALAPHLQRVQFRLLGRESLKKALDSGAISALDIGREFRFFDGKSPEEKLIVLEKLGVLRFLPGQSVRAALAGKAFQQSIPIVMPPRPRIEPLSPPISRPAETPAQKGQLDLFDPKRTK